MKLRMLLKSANVDPGLVEITPFGGRRDPAPGQKLKRVVDAAGGRERDLDPKTGEVFHEYLRGLLSIDLTFTASGEQGTTSFDDVAAWVKAYFTHSQQGLLPLLEVTIDEVQP